MARQFKGDGSVYRSKDGAGWIASLEAPTVDGRRRRLKPRARTKADALDLLQEMRAEVSKSGRMGDGKRLVSDAIGDYQKVRLAADLAPRTIEGDQWMASIVLSGLGQKRLTDLTVTDCDAFLQAAASGNFQGGELGRRSVTRIRSLLINAINNDLRRGFAIRNVAELSVLPASTKPRKPKRAITLAELLRLLDTASGAVGVLIDLSGRNGLRPAEARGLRWSRVDLVEMTITIDGQMNRRDELTKAKVARAVRTIRFDSQSADRLAEWSKAQKALREHAGVGWHDADLVSTARSGRPISHRNFYRSLQNLCAKVAIKPAISAYELRHTAITLQAEAGHPAWQIADWAGTSERMITDVYRHRLQAVSSLGPVV